MTTERQTSFEDKRKLWENYQQALYEKEMFSHIPQKYFAINEKILECEKQLYESPITRPDKGTVEAAKKNLLGILINLIKEDKIKGPIWNIVQSDINDMTYDTLPSQTNSHFLDKPFASEAVEFIDIICNKASKTSDINELKAMKNVLWQEGDKNTKEKDNVLPEEKNKFLEAALSNDSLWPEILKQYIRDRDDKKTDHQSSFNQYRTASLTPKAIETLMSKDLNLKQFLAIAEEDKTLKTNPEIMKNKFLDIIVSASQSPNKKNHITDTLITSYQDNRQSYYDYLQKITPNDLKREDITPEVIAYADPRRKKNKDLLQSYASIHGFNATKMKQKVDAYRKTLDRWLREKTAPLDEDIALERPQSPEHQKDAILANYTYARLLNHQAIGVAKHGEAFDVPYTPDEHMNILKEKLKSFQSVSGKESKHTFAHDYTEMLDSLAPKTETVETIKEVNLSRVRQLVNRMTRKETPTEIVKEEKAIPQERREKNIQEQFSAQLEKLFYKDIVNKTEILFTVAFENSRNLTGVSIPDSKESSLKKSFKEIPMVKEMETQQRDGDMNYSYLQNQQNDFGIPFIYNVLMPSAPEIPDKSSKKIKPRGLRREAVAKLLEKQR